MCVFSQVTAALCVLVNVEEVESVVREMFPRFFADLLLRIGVSAELQLADPKRKQKQPSAAQYVTHKNLNNVQYHWGSGKSYCIKKKHVKSLLPCLPFKMISFFKLMPPLFLCTKYLLCRSQRIPLKSQEISW